MASQGQAVETWFSEGEPVFSSQPQLPFAGLPQLPPERVGRHGSKLEQEWTHPQERKTPAGEEDALRRRGRRACRRGRRASQERKTLPQERKMRQQERKTRPQETAVRLGGAQTAGASGPCPEERERRSPPPPPAPSPRLDPFLGW